MKKTLHSCGDRSASLPSCPPRPLWWKARALVTNHDDEVLGKAYDARLMRRLLHYLRPYWRQVASVVRRHRRSARPRELAQPYLIKVAIDSYIATGQLAGLDRLAALYLAILIVAFAAEYAQTWTLQLTGQRIMFDLRMELYRHLQRLDLATTIATRSAG